MSFLQGGKHLFVPTKANAYRPHLLSKPYLLGLLVIVLAAEGLVVGNLLLRETGHPFGAAVITTDIVSLTNAERAKAGQAVLAEDAGLDAAAHAKAEDMAAKGYFSHIGPDGKEPWAWIEESGYDYQYAGENLAVRFVDSKDVVDAWMASPTHKANIVKSTYTQIGVGIAQGVYKGSPATFVVQYFGKPQASVLGAAVSPTSFTDSLTRQVIKILAEPRTTALWTSGLVAALILVAIAFAVFHHVQIQAHDMLAPGAVVAGIALTFMALNVQLLTPSTQGAAAVTSGWSVEVGRAVSTER